MTATISLTGADILGAYYYLEDGPRGRPIFVVGARPHIMVKLKRMIPMAYQDGRSGYLWITATRELARDLEWFCERYPLTPYDDRSAGILTKLADEHRAGEERVARILDGDIPPLDPDRTPQVTPREYQLVPRAMIRAQGFLLLGDDVGLGKTLEASLMFSDLDALRGLVVAPHHLVDQWAVELEKYFPWLNTHVVRKGTPYTANQTVLLRRLDQAHVLITNYHKLGGWGDYLQGKMSTVIFDEAHELRTGAGTGKYTAAEMVARAARYRVLMTATPVYNYGKEVHHIVSIMAPDVLGTLDEYVKEHGGDRTRDPRALGAYLRESGILLRRTRKEVGRELPPVSIMAQPVETNRTVLDDMIREGIVAMAAKVLAADTDATERWTISGQLDMKVRHATGVAKAPYVAQFVKMLLESGIKKIGLVGHHHDCFVAGTKVLMYDGSQRNVEAVREGELVMGPDSKPRTVRSLVQGYGNLYRIVPKKGDSWVCSENHILSVWNERGFYEQMTAREFYEMPETRRRRRFLYRAESVEFGGSRQVIEPWLVGFWLGDGAANLNDLRVCSRDPEIRAEAQRIAERHGLVVRAWTAPGASRTSTAQQLCLSTGTHSGPKGRNLLVQHFRALGLHRNKHIPKIYLTASISDRRELLAGLIDADANVHPGQWTRTATFTTIDREFAEQVAFLARSLGLAGYVKTKATSASGYGGAGRVYYNVSISGDLTQLPMRIERKKAQPRPSIRNVLRDGFTIEEVGAGDFYGFEVDADSLFLLGDFTVVHNCYDIWVKELAEYNPVLYTGRQSSPQKKAAVDAFVNGDSRVFIMALRSGAGLNGLQEVSDTVVIGEPDWSPAQHTQVIGRWARDGQQNPVAVFFMMSDAGSDPAMEDLLQLKRSIAEPINDPDAEVVQPSPDEAMRRVQALARSVLAQNGVHLDQPSMPDPEPGSGELFSAETATAVRVPVGELMPADAVSGPGRDLVRGEPLPINAAGQVPSDMVPYYETQQGLAEITAAASVSRLDDRRRLHPDRDGDGHHASRTALKDRLNGADRS